MSTKIMNFSQVDNFYRNGINLCKGCRYERYASCTEDRLPECNKQLTKQLQSNDNLFEKKSNSNLNNNEPWAAL